MWGVLVIREDWKFEDFFRLSVIDEHALKKDMAAKLGLSYGDDTRACYAHSVGGIHAFDPKILETRWLGYKAKKDAVATTLQDIEIKAKTLDDLRTFTMSASGLQLAWCSPSWLNVGYIKKWADDHMHEWDSTVERRAGGFDPTTTYTTQRFSSTNRSSIFALIATTVYEFKTTGAIGASVAHAFSRVRLLFQFDLGADDVLLINQAENIEQHKRKRHTELDNIDAVSVWKMAITGQGPMSAMKPDACLDVFKYACTLSDRSGRPSWLMKELKGKGDSPKEVAAILVDKKMNRKYMEQSKITTCHPHVKNYSDISQRHRFLKGFSQAAYHEMQELAGDMGARGMAHGYYPLTKAVILDPVILTSDAFGTQREKEEVLRNYGALVLELCVLGGLCKIPARSPTKV